MITRLYKKLISGAQWEQETTKKQSNLWAIIINDTLEREV